MITIKGRVPSKKNSKQIVCRGKYPMLLPSKQYTEWHKDAVIQLNGVQKIKSKKIEITFFAPDARKFDLTNKAESILDLFVDCGIIEDDNYTIIKEVNLKFGGIDKLNPRAEIKEL